MGRRVIYKDLFVLAFPIILQQFVSISLNFTDNIMVGTIGVFDIAAVGFANKVFFVCVLSIFGAIGGLSVFMAQFYGKKDIVMVRKLFALAIIVAVIIGLLYFLVAFFFTETVIRIFSNDEKVIAIGVDYLMIASFTYPMMGITFAMTTVLRSTGNTVTPLIITVFATIVHIFLNYCFIYGNFGFPELGSKGAALATLLSRFLEMLCFLYFIFFMNDNLKTNFKNYFGVSRDLIKSIIKISIPIFLTEFLWVIGTTLILVAYAKLGTDVAAAVQIGDLVLSFGSIVFLGIAIATNIMVAQRIGAGDGVKVFFIAKEIIKISVVFSALVVILGLLITQPILFFYTLTEELEEMARMVLIITAFAMFFKMLNWVVIVGVLRAGGDTIFAFWLDIGILLSYAVPIAFIGAMVLDISIYYLIVLVNLEEVLKLLVALWRFRSQKWINNLTELKQHH